MSPGMTTPEMARKMLCAMPRPSGTSRAAMIERVATPANAATAPAWNSRAQPMPNRPSAWGSTSPPKPARICWPSATAPIKPASTDASANSRKLAADASA